MSCANDDELSRCTRQMEAIGSRDDIITLNIITVVALGMPTATLIGMRTEH